jgi:hypothetical protein
MMATTHAISSKRDGVILCGLGRPGPFVHFSLKEFGFGWVTCEPCRSRLEARQAIHARLTAPRTGPTLLDQIKADMRRRYGPAIEHEDWETE